MSAETEREPFLKDALKVFEDASQLLFELTKKDLQGRDQTLFIPLSACCNTALGIHKLLRNDIHTENEAYMLMRALLERIVNLNYLRVAEQVEVNKYFSYPRYRMYHTSKGTQNKKISVRLNNDALLELEKNPDVQKALRLFSKTNPRMNWTDKTFNQRLQIVIEKTNFNEGVLLLSSMLTYKDASEVLHGSFYGHMFLTGMYTMGDFKDASHPKKSEVSRNISMKLTLPLMLLAGVIVGTVQLISKNHDLTDLIERGKDIESAITKVLESTQQ
ncbi:MAG TPA: DUF5677 domain-containing protein [Candidatus Saccharimonadales bacterium]|nr:DUF5677 domain-containing protein [Candidatus Saccharimonadales bacterium]